MSYMLIYIALNENFLIVIIIVIDLRVVYLQESRNYAMFDSGWVLYYDISILEGLFSANFIFQWCRKLQRFAGHKYFVLEEERLTI